MCVFGWGDKAGETRVVFLSCMKPNGIRDTWSGDPAQFTGRCQRNDVMSDKLFGADIHNSMLLALLTCYGEGMSWDDSMSFIQQLFLGGVVDNPLDYSKDIPSILSRI